MNIFVTTQFCLPKITDAELRKALENSDAVFEIKLIRGKDKKRSIDYRGENPGFQEIKMKSGQVKLIALDCKVKSDKRSKITCWNHCGRPGHEENGMPVLMRERAEEDEPVIEIGRYGYFCGCSCMYAFVLDRSRGDHADSVKYKKIAHNAEILYKMCHPDKGSIVPAKPWELLRCNGGTLDYDVWEDEDLKLQRMPGFTYTQAHQSYS